jgi:hypothetical protein
MQPTLKPASPARVLHFLCAALLAAAWLGLADPAAAQAQGYPNKPIRMIVPYPTSTVSDMVGRLLAGHMSKTMGQPVVVENIPPAGGVVGTQQLVRAPKDGYTIGILNNGHVINPSIFKDLGFDTLKDIEPVSRVGSSPLVLVTNAALPAKDLREVLGIARTKSRELTFGSMGNGTVVHLTGVLLNLEGNVDIKHIPYGTASQLLSDVIGGQVDMGFFGVATAAAQVESGKVRAVGVTTRQRSPLLPNVPTFIEQGLPNYNFDGWMAMVAPAGTPRAVVERLNAEVRAALAQKEIQEAMAKIGVTLGGSTPEETAQFFRSELDKHTLLARRGGAKLD